MLLSPKIDSVYELNSSLKDSNSGESFNFGSLNGVRGFFTNPSKADDSFVPFKSGVNLRKVTDNYITGGQSYKFTKDYDFILIVWVIFPITVTTNAELLFSLQTNNQYPSIKLYKNIKAGDVITQIENSPAPEGFMVFEVI